MKNTIRVRHDNGANHSRAQVQPAQAARRSKLPPELSPSNECYPTVLAFFCRTTGKGFKRIPITDEEFCKLSMEANKQKISPEDLIAEALRKRLMDQILYVLIDELEINCLKINSLLQLLADKFDHINTRQGDDLRAEECQHFVNGVSFLVKDSQNSLSLNFKHLFNHVRMRPAAPEAVR
jgi:hypothetical protein